MPHTGPDERQPLPAFETWRSSLPCAGVCGETPGTGPTVHWTQTRRPSPQAVASCKQGWRKGPWPSGSHADCSVVADKDKEMSRSRGKYSVSPRTHVLTLCVAGREGTLYFLTGCLGRETGSGAPGLVNRPVGHACLLGGGEPCRSTLKNFSLRGRSEVLSNVRPFVPLAAYQSWQSDGLGHAPLGSARRRRPFTHGPRPW